MDGAIVEELEDTSLGYDCVHDELLLTGESNPYSQVAPDTLGAQVEVERGLSISNDSLDAAGTI
jgi:hypothetical protein